jgi:hypothetical protein
MQKSDKNDEKNKNWGESSIAIRACPRCGNGKTRCSPARSSDRFFNIWFRKSYRCQTCRHRFWVLRSLRLIIVAGILLLLIPVAEVVWMEAVVQQPEVNAPVEAASQDQIKSLAEKGDAEAELQMGLRHTSMAWGMKDDKMAAEWFEKAARHDQIEAGYRYGLALLEGRGVIQDYKEAFYWLEKAARQGHSLAQFALGGMYQSGAAIDSDIERAYLWFNLAAAQGVGNAASARDSMAKLLTPTQIASIQEEARRIAGTKTNKPVPAAK